MTLMTVSRIHPLYSFMLALVLGLILSFPMSARAGDELIVYEGFDYATGQLRDRDGGYGWAGPWTDAHQRVVGDQSLESALGDTPKTLGGHAVTPNGDWPAKRGLKEPFAAGPGTYWVSLLAVNLSGQVEDTYGRVAFIPESGNGFAFAKPFSGPRWALEAGGRTTGTQVASNDRPVFAVIRVTIGEEEGTSRVALFLDPDLGREPVTPDAEISGVTIPPILRVEMRSGTDTKEFGFDEIRMGQSFKAVAPQP